MKPGPSFLRAGCALTLALLSASARSQRNVSEPTPLAATVSIGDVIQAQDAKARVQGRSNEEIAAALANVMSGEVVTPLHLIYVHGMDDVGPNDSALFRRSICKYLGECTVSIDPPVYAAGPFALDAPIPALTYLQQPIWASQQEWNASAPYIQRYRISGNGHTPIVLDEINWYPLVYPLKCKFLLPGEDQLTGGMKRKSKDAVCRPPANVPDPVTPGRFLAYRWLANAPLYTTDLPRQHAAWVNADLKINVMDWGFGDAVLSMGPMREILTAAIRQLLAQSLTNLTPASQPDQSGETTSRPRGLAPPAPSADNDDAPLFFITHSLGSYLTLTALDSAWLGTAGTEVAGFEMTPAQTQAVDFLARHTTGFYFLANQIGLLELARLSPPAPATQPDCSRAATRATGSSPEPAAVALSHYGCMRHNYLAAHPDLAANAGPLHTTGPQIIAWSSPDDLLTWYVPAITGVAVVNLPAHNSGFRIPWLIASPLSAHDNYAINPHVAGQIFLPTKRH